MFEGQSKPWKARRGAGFRILAGWPALAMVLLVFGSGSAAPAETAVWDQLLRKHGFKPEQVGLVILDGEGKTIAEINGERPFIPASNQKVLVAAAALEELGADFQYRTVLWSDREPAGGVLPGDLVVSGDGDPNISGRFQEDDPTRIFRDWAAALRRNGIERIAGDLLIDDFRFDDQRFLPTWKENQWSRWYSAQIGALNLNDNCVDVTVAPAQAGAPARFRISPSTRYVEVENRCRTAPAGGDPVIILERVRGTNRIRIDGTIPAGSRAWTGPVTIDDPGLYFGAVLEEVFEEEGLRIDGRVARDRARLPDPARRVVLHRHLSPLRLDIPVILRNSQNLHAEVLLKALGTARGETGSVAAGARAIEEFLDANGIAAPGLAIADGSGFSPQNRVAPMTLARLLHWTARRDYFPLFRGGLAVAGENGTLRRRFTRPPVRGRVLAKTGTIAGVSTLSGYLLGAPASDTADAGMESVWVFSILINGFPSGGTAAAYRLQEDIAAEALRRMGAGG